MAFADALNAEVKRTIIKGPPCSVGVTLDVMSQTDADALQEALHNPNVASMDIVRALNAEGYRVGANAVSRHRRGHCNCELRRGVR